MLLYLGARSLAPLALCVQREEDICCYNYVGVHWPLLHCVQREEALRHGEADEEGWITVTRVKKNKGAPLTEAEADRVKRKEDQKKKKKVCRHFDRSCYFYHYFFFFLL
jgi:hypothetical protein